MGILLVGLGLLAIRLWQRGQQHPNVAARPAPPKAKSVADEAERWLVERNSADS